MTMEPKEILRAYCSTLTDKQAKIAYQLLTERFEIHKKKFLLFNRDGKEAKAPDGKIRLRPFHVERILATYGEWGFHHLIEILYDYIVYLENNVDCVASGRRKLNNLSQISHYNILTKGWVAEKFHQMYPNFSIVEEEEEELVDFFKIENRSQAIKFINQTPKELRYDNEDIVYLCTQYDIKPEDIEDE